MDAHHFETKRTVAHWIIVEYIHGEEMKRHEVPHEGAFRDYFGTLWQIDDAGEIKLSGKVLDDTRHDVGGMVAEFRKGGTELFFHGHFYDLTTQKGRDDALRYIFEKGIIRGEIAQRDRTLGALGLSHSGGDVRLRRG